MTEDLYDMEETLIPWIQERIPVLALRDEAKAIGARRNGEIIACVAFYDFTKTSCSIAVASNGEKDWLSSGYLERIFSYPFVQCDLKRLTALISSENIASINLCKDVGFKQESSGANTITFAMSRDDCKWLPNKSDLKA